VGLVAVAAVVVAAADKINRDVQDLQNKILYIYVNLTTFASATPSCGVSTAKNLLASPGG
jgi:hypothetical protein